MAEGEAGSAEPRRAPLYKRVTLSLSAFVMSLGATLLSIYYGLQGSEIVVRPPEQVLLYRDGDGDKAVLGFAVQVPMINTAANHGDLLVDVEVKPTRGDARFAFSSLVRPVFTATAAKAAESCDLEARCLGLPGLLVIERPEEIVDVPGGAARSPFFGFALVDWNCVGKACENASDFKRAVRWLEARPLDITIELKFNSDGRRAIRCTGGRIDAAYLRDFGWSSLSCASTKVSGAPFL